MAERITSKEGDGTSKESSEADVQAAVDEASGQAIRNTMLHQGALDHVQHWHGVNLQDRQ